LKNKDENREIATKRNEQRQLEEQRENMIVAVMNDMQKKIAKMTKLKEIEVRRRSLLNIYASRMKVQNEWLSFIHYYRVVAFVFVVVGEKTKKGRKNGRKDGTERKCV